MDNDALIALFLQELRDLSKCKPSTVRSQGYLLRSFFTWMDSHGYSLESVSIEMLQDFVYRSRYHRSGRGAPSPSTVAREVTFLRGFLTYAIECEVQFTPVFRRQLTRWRAGRPAAAVPKPMPDTSWQAVWHLGLTREERLWLGLGYFLGFRKIEFIMVHTDDWDRENGVVTFKRKGRYDAKPHRLPYADMVNVELRPHLPWHSEAAGDFLVLLHKWIDVRDGELYLNPRTRARIEEAERGRLEAVPVDANLAYYTRRLALLCDRAGVPVCSPHQLRHACATNLYRAGTPFERIAFLMNHASLEMTRRYADVSTEFTEYRKKHRHSVDDGE